jgi:hypothetical protein
MKAKCERCKEEFEFGEGAISLICQKCGCTDLRFDTDLLAFPLYITGDPVPQKMLREVAYHKDTPFCGGHDFGILWRVQLIAQESQDQTPPPEETGEVEQEQEETKESTEPKEEKPSLLKAAKKLRVKIGNG